MSCWNNFLVSQIYYKPWGSNYWLHSLITGFVSQGFEIGIYFMSTIFSGRFAKFTFCLSCITRKTFGWVTSEYLEGKKHISLLLFCWKWMGDNLKLSFSYSCFRVLIAKSLYYLKIYFIEHYWSRFGKGSWTYWAIIRKRCFVKSKFSNYTIN